MSAELILPLKCSCGNRDDITITLPLCSAGCERRMEVDPGALEAMLAVARIRKRLDHLVSIGAISHAESVRLLAAIAQELARP